MRLIIAGTRTLHPTLDDITRALEHTGWRSGLTEIVSGGAPGVDLAGEVWARANQIPVGRFIAYWDREGKAAGPKRNARMAAYADALLAFHDGVSRGTADMIVCMYQLDKPVMVQYPITPYASIL